MSEIFGGGIGELQGSILQTIPVNCGREHNGTPNSRLPGRYKKAIEQIQMIKGYIRTQFIEPVIFLLRRGISPEKIAMSMAWGFTLGTLPVLGVTTILCLGVAVLLRLNLVMIQIANWAAYPLQIILFIPFFMVGARLFGTEPAMKDTSSLTAVFQSSFVSSVELLGGAMLHAAIVWAFAAPFLIAVLYWTIKPLLRRLMKDQGSA